MKNKKFRVFKFDFRVEIKNYFYTSKFEEKTLLVMGANINKAFKMSFVGSTKTGVTMVARTRDFLEDGPFCLVRNELHVFGGRRDDRKVRR